MATMKISEAIDSDDYVLPLPVWVMEEMEWIEGDTLSVTKVNRTIHLTKIVEDI
jgi:hypothetical protein